MGQTWIFETELNFNLKFSSYRVSNFEPNGTSRVRFGSRFEQFGTSLILILIILLIIKHVYYKIIQTNNK